MNIFKIGIILREGTEYILDVFFAFFYKRCFGRCGRNVMIKPVTSVFKGLNNIYISDDVQIARYALLYTTNARIYIGSKTCVAPYLKIVSGNHRTDCVGHYMFDADYEKNPDDDQDVIIEGDTWIGLGVTILKGVTIGRGSVIAAGAIVTKSMPPYSIIVGAPAKALKQRFSKEQILEHERLLYPEEKRLNEEQLKDYK